MDHKFIRFLSKTEVEIAGTIYKFRDPNLWAFGEVCDIEDESTIFEGGVPKISTKVMKTKAIAKATGLTEAEVAKLPYYVAQNLFEVVRWRPVPLSDSPISNSESGEEGPTQSDSPVPSG